MSGTVLTHPLVRGYLRDLAAACATLPAPQARELREQITAHLDEALPPGTGDDAIRTELDRLGSPFALATEAAGPIPFSAGTRLRNRLSRLRWWVWTSIAAVVAAIATAAGYLIVVRSVPPPSTGALSAWYFPQDSGRSVITRAGDVTQWTVPERYGQRQGFVIGIENDTDWTQTIIGLDPVREPGALRPMSAALGFGPGIEHGAWAPQDPQFHWVLPAAIPPHSYRPLRVLWTSNMCLPPNSAFEFTDLFLRVRVGFITRTEDIPLATTWAISGTNASRC